MTFFRRSGLFIALAVGLLLGVSMAFCERNTELMCTGLIEFVLLIAEY
jgi:hypothetical protein